MSTKSSPDLDSAAKPGRGMMRHLLLHVLAGLSCVVVASYIAQHVDLGRNLVLDLKGERAPGTAEFDASGVCRLRFVDRGDVIYRRRYEGGFGLQRVRGPEAAITVVYDPEHPNQFQPLGLSYVPAVGTGVLFAAGLYLVLRSRRLILQTRRETLKANRPPAEGDKPAR